MNARIITFTPRWLEALMRADERAAIARGLIVPPKRQTRAQRIFKRAS